MKSKKILIIVIIIIAILAISGTSLAFLYMTTDFLKSDKELVAKYMSQTMEIFNELSNSKAMSSYKELKNQNYEANTEISITHSEGGEISNPINDFAIKLNSQRDNVNKYFYGDAQLLFKEEEYLKLEAIKDVDTYGMRISTLKPFITIRNDENLDTVVNSLGINTKAINEIFGIIDGNIYESTSNDVTILKDTYVNIIKKNLENATYSSLKNSIITINNNSTEANAYIVTLTGEQVRNLLIEMLENVEVDGTILNYLSTYMDEQTFINGIDKIIEEIQAYEEMPQIKITFYAKSGTLLRVVFEIDTDQIIMDNLSTDGQLKINLHLNFNTLEEPIDQTIELVKTNSENQEIYNITTGDTEIGKTDIVIQTQINNDSVVTNAKLSYTKGITVDAIVIDNQIANKSVIQRTEELTESNNMVLNDLSEEERLQVIQLLQTNIPNIVTSRIQSLIQKLEVEENEQPIEENPEETQMSQVEVNRFNAKFEFYTGDSVSAANVKTLLDIVKTNIDSVEFIPTTNTNAQNETLQQIKLNIEQNKENSALIDEILETIEDNKKYKVSITYKGENQIIDYITIDEVVE